MAKNSFSKIGVWSFIAGLVIAVIASLIWGVTSTVVWILGILGILVGLININDRETMPYLVASIALMVGAAGLSNVIGAAGIGIKQLTDFLYAIVVFVAPGAVVVAIKAIYNVAHEA
ncbi:MAG: hypothetical protein V1645_01180 [archaeon]